MLVGTTQIHTADTNLEAVVALKKGATLAMTKEERAAKEAALARFGRGIQKINPEELLHAGHNYRGDTVAGTGRRGIGATAKAQQQAKAQQAQEERRAAKRNGSKRK